MKTAKERLQELATGAGGEGWWEWELFTGDGKEGEN